LTTGRSSRPRPASNSRAAALWLEFLSQIAWSISRPPSRRAAESSAATRS